MARSRPVATIILAGLLAAGSLTSAAARAASPHVHVVTRATFEAEVLRAELPVLVFFSSTWAGPAKAMRPTVEAFAAAFAGRVKVVDVDIDADQELTRSYQVRSVPTCLVFKGGSTAGTLVGLRTEVAQLARLVGVEPSPDAPAPEPPTP